MEFNLRREISFFNFDGSQSFTKGYVTEPHGIFAICKKEPDSFDSRSGWVLVHRISQTILLGVLRNKRDLEIFYKFLSEEYELDSLYLVNPHGHAVKKELRQFISIAYSKFYMTHRRPFG